MSEAVDAWFKESPFLRDLGVGTRGDELTLTVSEPHTASGALHGGAIASLAMLSAHATMRTPDLGFRASTVSLHVNYARAGRGRSFTASTSAVRRARELGFYETLVRDAHGETIANASATLGEVARGGGVVAPAAPLLGDPAEFNAETQAISFLNRRGLHVEGIDRGRLEISMAAAERNLDSDGTIQEGAALTLIDLAGASVPWTLPRPSAAGAAIALHAQILGRLPARSLVARAWVRARDERVSWSDVTIVDLAGDRVCALGTGARAAVPPLKWTSLPQRRVDQHNDNRVGPRWPTRALP